MSPTRAVVAPRPVPVQAENLGRKLGVRLGDLPALAMVGMVMLRRQQPERNVRSRPLLERPAPRISVVIPCLNEHEGLVRTIRSVVAQDYPPTEIVVVDRGSQDATRKVLQELGASVVGLSSPPEDGEIGAIKAGFDAATGEYVICLPAGDLLMPGALDRVRFAVRYRSYRVMWFCEMEDCEHGGERPRPASPQPGVSMRRLLKGVVPHPSAVAVRRSVYQKAAGTLPASDLAGVRDLWFRLACRTRFRRINGTLGCRCKSPRVIGEHDAEHHAREFERSAACVKRQMRWTARIMGVGRHLLATIDDTYRWAGTLWASRPSQVAVGNEPLAPAGSGEHADGSPFAGRDCLPG